MVRIPHIVGMHCRPAYALRHPRRRATRSRPWETAERAGTR